MTREGQASPTVDGIEVGEIQSGGIEISGTNRKPQDRQLLRKALDSKMKRRINFSVEVGSSVVGESRAQKLSQGIKNQVIMFSSMKEFRSDGRENHMMRRIQNATTRHAAGFRGQGARNMANTIDPNQTLFSNSFIRDSVISTLKHNSRDGEAVRGDRYSDVSSEVANSVAATLNQPRLSQLERRSDLPAQVSPAGKQEVHYPSHMGAKRPSLLS